jgi:lysophospholipase L1-like esterase
VNNLKAPFIMTSMISTALGMFAILLSALASPVSSNPYSFPSIHTYIALGDSYASGHGAGTNTGFFCGRYSDAYPVQLTKAIGPVRFHSAACGGASTATVVLDQLRWIGDSDLVTLTVGGNEVDFFSVLNECVYQWRPQGTCGEALRKSRRLMESSEFVEGYARMVKLGMERVKPGAKLLVTGYATFFNEETTACDGVSFSRTDSKQYLTSQLRRKLNQLVRMLNHIVRSAAEASGAAYVDIDETFKGHRFCEEGVHEPNNTRSDTWFFNLHYDGTIVSKAEATRHYHRQEVLSTGVGRGFVDVTRVFHPTKEGHTGIRDALVHYL